MSWLFFAYFPLHARQTTCQKYKSLESWIWDAVCSIRGANYAPTYKGYILPLIFTKRLDLWDVEVDMDITGKRFDYLIRKFAEGGGEGAGEWSGATWTAIGRPEGEGGGAHQFYTPGEVGDIMACALESEPGTEIYDPTCGSGGLEFDRLGNITVYPTPLAA